MITQTGLLVSKIIRGTVLCGLLAAAAQASWAVSAPQSAAQSAGQLQAVEVALKAIDQRGARAVNQPETIKVAPNCPGCGAKKKAA